VRFRILCPTRPCPLTIDGHVPRPDGVHFDDQVGARWVADRLIPMLLAPETPADPRVAATHALAVAA
jgi:hypothetical protein